MEYTNLIFFAISLLIYVTYTPNGKGDLNFCLLSFATLTGGYHLFTWFTYRHFRRKLEKWPHNITKIFRVVGTLEKRFILFALFLYFFLVYTSGLKNIIWRVSFIKKSAFLDLTAGLFPFLLFLMVLWFNAFSLFRASGDTKLNRNAYLRSHIKLSFSILLPVFFFSLFQDILRLLPIKGFNTPEILSSSEVIWFIPFLLFLIVFYPLVIKFVWNCYPLPKGPRRKNLEAHCHKSGLTISDILLCPPFYGRTLTAGITGIIGKLRYLFIAPELLNILNEDEIESVIAHEAGHVRMKHMYYYVLLFLGFPLSLFLVSNLFYLSFYGIPDFIIQHIYFGDLPPNILSLAVLALLTAFILFYLRIFFGIISRNFERQADLFVFQVVGHPLHLISSLEKISQYAGGIKDIANWHHFSISQRIKFLQDCQRDSHQIKIHQKRVRRIKKSLVSFLAGTLLLLGVLNHPQINQRIKLHLMEEKIRQALIKKPHSTELQSALADILLEKKAYRQAELLYQQVLQGNPNNVTALNNLAWLYATTKNAPPGAKKRSLALSLKAAAIKQEPFILDTLAEAYFINGEKEKALQAIEAAIALHPDNIDYYISQRQKFIKNESR